jgi:hypothetical protein
VGIFRRLKVRARVFYTKKTLFLTIFYPKYIKKQLKHLEKLINYLKQPKNHSENPKSTRDQDFVGLISTISGKVNRKKYLD